MCDGRTKAFHDAVGKAVGRIQSGLEAERDALKDKAAALATRVQVCFEHVGRERERENRVGSHGGGNALALK